MPRCRGRAEGKEHAHTHVANLMTREPVSARPIGLTAGRGGSLIRKIELGVVVVAITATIGVLTFAAGTFLEAAAEAIEPTAQLQDQGGQPPPPVQPPPPEPPVAEDPEPEPEPEPLVCLGGRRPDKVRLKRPAVAVKVENAPVAWPPSGLEKAEIVYEELVEGGVTRFMAIYHCSDAPKVGPVRSARVVDPAIMKPYTRILGAAGANAIVQRALDKARVISINEEQAGSAMRRVYRPGLASEHTLYGSTKALRKIGRARFDKPPPQGIFSYGPLKSKAKKIRSVTMSFGDITQVVYRWIDGKWRRFEDGAPFVAEGGRQIAVDNVLIERHRINYSKGVVDVAGTPSTEIADTTGSGAAFLLRDHRLIRGKWVRKSVKKPAVFKTHKGKEMVLGRGKTWIELLPTGKGQAKGTVSFG
ncbi:MAG: DUF3048 domain-containing protein [Actinomycetota bacterium]|nr:DUF3048 domain-containing protein [Actinomycetota bacterium]